MTHSINNGIKGSSRINIISKRSFSYKIANARSLLQKILKILGSLSEMELYHLLKDIEQLEEDINFFKSEIEKQLQSLGNK